MPPHSLPGLISLASFSVGSGHAPSAYPRPSVPHPHSPLQPSSHFWAPYQAVQLLIHPGLADLFCFFGRSIEQDLADGSGNRKEEGGQSQCAATNLSQVFFFKIGTCHYGKGVHSVGHKLPCREMQCVFVNAEYRTGYGDPQICQSSIFCFEP